MPRLTPKTVLLIALLLTLFFSCMPQGQAEAVKYEAPKQIVITFTGDCTLGIDDRERGKATGFDAFIQQYGIDYPFEKVRDIFANDDLTVINLEGTLYNSDAGRAKKTYAFRGDTSYVQMLLNAGIEACSLGNNHSMDYGMAGLQSTVDTLEANGIGWFGSENEFNHVFVFEKDGIKIGFVSMYEKSWWDKIGILASAFEQLRAQNCDLIIGFPHAGIEYDVRYDRGGGQDRLVEKMLNFGCDLIVCNHAHTIQGIRQDGDKTVLWGLGNFVFGGNSKIKNNAMGEPTNYTYLAQFTLSFDENNKYLGHQLNIIPIVVATGRDKAGELRNYYQPTLATGKDAEFVMNAIKRDRTPGNLKVNPYVEGVGALQDFIPASIFR